MRAVKWNDKNHEPITAVHYIDHTCRGYTRQIVGGDGVFVSHARAEGTRRAAGRFGGADLLRGPILQAQASGAACIFDPHSRKNSFRRSVLRFIHEERAVWVDADGESAGIKEAVVLARVDVRQQIGCVLRIEPACRDRRQRGERRLAGERRVGRGRVVDRACWSARGRCKTTRCERQNKNGANQDLLKNLQARPPHRLQSILHQNMRNANGFFCMASWRPLSWQLVTCLYLGPGVVRR